MVLAEALKNNEYAKYIGVMFVDSTARPNIEYQYKINELIKGHEFPIALSNWVKSGNYTFIEPPKDISIEARKKKVSFIWKYEPMRYWGVNVYRKESADTGYIHINKLPVMVSEVKKPGKPLRLPDEFFLDQSLRKNTEYTYVLKGIDFFGKESLPSENITVFFADSIPPAPPIEFDYDRNNYEITLTWNRPEINDWQGVNVYRSRYHGHGYEKLNTQILPVNMFLFRDLVSDDGFYYYYVASVDSSGNEGKTPIAMVEIPDVVPPPVPDGLYSEADTGLIRLWWNSVYSDDLMGYRIYRTVNKDDPKRFVLLNSTPVADTFFVDTLPKNAKNFFFYKIVSVDSNYNMSNYSEFSKSQMPDIEPPVKPVIISVDKAGEHLQVKWIKNVEPDLNGYNVYRYAMNDSINTIKRLNATLIDPVSSIYTDRWAEPFIEYAYFLQALDSTGNKSEYSESFSGRLTKTESIESSDISSLNCKLKNNQIIVSWNLKKSKLFTGVVVFKKVNDDIWRPASGKITIDEFVDKDIAPGNNYYYKVKVFDSNGKSAYSIIDKISYESAEE
jgi:fibronectin type 3 domain-containing protein